MKRAAAMAMTLATAGCGFGGGETCKPNADVVSVGVLETWDGARSQSLTLKIGQTVRLCIFGSHGCMAADQRFELRSDAPAVAAAGAAPGESPLACNDLVANYAYDCCPVDIGRLTAVAAGTAHVEAVLVQDGRVEKAAGLVWCDPYSPTAGAFCHPISVVVTP